MPMYNPTPNVVIDSIKIILSMQKKSNQHKVASIIGVKISINTIQWWKAHCCLIQNTSITPPFCANR